MKKKKIKETFCAFFCQGAVASLFFTTKAYGFGKLFVILQAKSEKDDIAWIDKRVRRSYRS